MKTWISDNNNNRCSVEKYGSEESAKKALATLRGCSRCWDCSECSDCWGCSRCCDSAYCSGCSDLSGCSRCWDCSECSQCSGCSGLSGCSDRSDCSGNKGDVVPPIIPKIENIDKVLYETIIKDTNTLDMSDWHTCATTHCRAGWIVALAGDAGKALEKYHNTPLAAQLIYKASGSPINPCRFFDSDEDTLADIKARAGN